jgi:hypothetical protein
LRGRTKDRSIILTTHFGIVDLNLSGTEHAVSDLHHNRSIAIPPKEVLGILATLQGLGFDDQLLGSEKCVLERLKALNNEEIARIKRAFVRYNHPRFFKTFSYHLTFDVKQTYPEQIEDLNREKLAHLIKICGFLMQTKVYLFWQTAHLLAAETDCQKQSIDKK